MMHIGTRNCSRCGKELTDAASMECGVGPICRKMDNYLLALTIPADVEAARKAFFASAIDEYALGRMDEAAWATATEATMGKVADTLSVVGINDWRETVKRIEWVLSHNLPKSVTEALYATVAALGYTALVSMWKGEAASGKSTVRFEAGRLFLKGPRNKAGIAAIKALKGRRFHGETKEWSVPVLSTASIEAFNTVLTAHWPNHDAMEKAEAFTAAAAYVLAAGELSATVPMASEKPKAGYTVEGETLVVKTPYHADFVAALKNEVPWKRRSWDSLNKVWRVQVGCESTVKELLNKYFPLTVAGTGTTVV